MAARRNVDPGEVRAAVAVTVPWLDGQAQQPARRELGEAVRQSLRTLERIAPGHAVEVRVPPHGVVQCMEGPRHTRGTPPNVIETDPRTWLCLVTGRTNWQQATEQGTVSASGSRADLSPWLPLLCID